MSFTIKEDNISIFNADITSSFNVSYDSYFRLSFSCRKGTTKYDVSTSCPNLIVFILKKKPARLSFSGYLSLKTFNNQSGHPTISRRVTIKQVLVGGDGEHITGLNVVEASDEFWLLQYIHENYDRWDIQTKHRPLAILSKLQDMVSARAPNKRLNVEELEKRRAIKKRMIEKKKLSSETLDLSSKDICLLVVDV